MPLTSPGLGARVVSEGCYGGTESDIEGQLTGHAKGKFCRMIVEKTSEKGALSRARWARENQRASPIWASDHRRGAGWGSSFRPLDFHIRINRTGPNPRLYYIITYSRFWDFPGPADLKTAHILQFAPLSHPITTLPALNALLLSSHFPSFSYFSPQFWLCISLVAQNIL